MRLSDHILTTPNMDRYSHIVAGLFRAMGCTFMTPPPLSPKTRELGRRLGSEGFCQPLNNCLGDIYLAVEQGATDVLVTVGVDACRYGFYWVNQKVILEEKFGRELTFHIIHHGEARKSVERVLDAIGCDYTRRQLDYAWLMTQERVGALTALSSSVNRARARQTKKGSTAVIYREASDAILAACSLTDIKVAKRGAEERLQALPQRRRHDALRVLLVGAIYEVLEPEANYSIEEYLGSLSVEVERSLNYHDLVPFIAPSGEVAYAAYEEMLTAHAARYINPLVAEHGFGGYGRMTIGHAARAKRHGFDGIIHVHSFSCMPEIVAKAFIRRISVEEPIPAITIVVEEISARELVYNRLEAFVDLMRERKRVASSAVEAGA